jgi:hypothetical protein
MPVMPRNPPLAGRGRRLKEVERETGSSARTLTQIAVLVAQIEGGLFRPTVPVLPDLRLNRVAAGSVAGPGLLCDLWH